jgi:hypothetical protein
VQGALDGRGHGVSTAERPDGSNQAKEDAVRIDRWSALEVAQERVTDLLGKRESDLPSGLPRDDEAAVFPVDVAKPQLGDLARAEPEPNEKEEDRAITSHLVRVAVARSEEPCDLGGREAAR